MDSPVQPHPVLGSSSGVRVRPNMIDSVSKVTGKLAPVNHKGFTFDLPPPQEVFVPTPLGPDLQATTVDAMIGNVQMFFAAAITTA